MEGPRPDAAPVLLLPLLRRMSARPPYTACLGLADDGRPLLIRLPSPEVGLPASLWQAVQAASLAEAISVIERSGLDREKALEVLKNGAPGSPLIKNVSGRMTARDYNVNFMLQLMRKDLGYAAAAAKNEGVEFQTGAGAMQLFDQALQKGLGEKDFSSVVEALR